MAFQSRHSCDATSWKNLESWWCLSHAIVLGHAWSLSDWAWLVEDASVFAGWVSAAHAEEDKEDEADEERKSSDTADNYARDRSG